MQTSKQTDNPVERFITMVGGMQRGAVLLGVTRQTMHTLVKQGRVTNAILAVRIEDLTGALERDGLGQRITVRELAGETETWTGPTLRTTSPFMGGKGRGMRSRACSTAPVASIVARAA